MKIKSITIAPDVEAVLRQAVLMGNMLVLQGQLSRDLYVKTNKVLELVGFKWSKKFKGHVGEGDSMDRLKEALSGGTVVDEKATFQFYETPDDLADRMVELANIREGDRVLEPSAGKGALVHAIFRRHKSFPRVFVCELEPKMRAARHSPMDRTLHTSSTPTHYSPPAVSWWRSRHPRGRSTRRRSIKPSARG